MYRVHFTDDDGQGSVDVEGYKKALDTKESLNKDTEHCAWDVWIENLDEPEW